MKSDSYKIFRKYTSLRPKKKREVLSACYLTTNVHEMRMSILMSLNWIVIMKIKKDNTWTILKWCNFQKRQTSESLEPEYIHKLQQKVFLKYDSTSRGSIPTYLKKMKLLEVDNPFLSIVVYKHVRTHDLCQKKFSLIV